MLHLIQKLTQRSGNMNNLGERLYELRTKHEMSQGNLAEKLDVSRQTISKWENNISIPELDKIIALSRVFDVSVDYLVKGEGVAITPDIIATPHVLLIMWQSVDNRCSITYSCNCFTLPIHDTSLPNTY